MTSPVPVGVLASGSGTNLQALIDACARPGFPARIAVVITNRKEAYARERARAAGIPVVYLRNRDYPSREAFDQQVVAVLQEHGVELVALAGFMRLVTPVLLRAFPDRVLNIHPALLPAFPGLHGQQQALEYGVKFSGCTVHLVDEGTDTGPIISQAVVPVYDDDTLETLQARILAEEHRIYPQALRLAAEGRLHREGRRVRVDGTPARPGAYHNPRLEEE